MLSVNQEFSDSCRSLIPGETLEIASHPPPAHDLCPFEIARQCNLLLSELAVHIQKSHFVGDFADTDLGFVTVASSEKRRRESHAKNVLEHQFAPRNV
ncbi:MAG TPA: hypothetical protein VFY28_03675 [Candidatus Paceibacterota bacterium]|nr:hypothetical protein [Candidatus Paceibacterota bacterium]